MSIFIAASATCIWKPADSACVAKVVCVMPRVVDSADRVVERGTRDAELRAGARISTVTGTSAAR